MLTAADRIAPLTAGDAPHQLLGLDADERDPVRIVAAAARRLATLTAAGGSETAVRRDLARLIRGAREALLRQTAQAESKAP